MARAGAKPKLNKIWHGQNPMPQKATLEQRIKWHKIHARACGCRPMPKSIADALRKAR